MIRRRSILVTLLLAAAATRANGCILEFRSTDWQVAQSPLVIVGTVVKVMPTAVAPEDAAIFTGGLVKPSTATVAVEQALKGDAGAKIISVASGPIRSCNPYPVHLNFTPGKSYVFILTPAENGYQLAWAGSLLETTDLAGVQDSIARMATWRTDYLARIEKQSPDILAAASKLDATLTAASKSWPIRNEDSLTPSELLHGISDDPATKAATDAVLSLLDVSTPTTVETALALDFNRPASDSGGWSHHPLWAQIRLRYTEAHSADVLEINESEWMRALPPKSTTREQYDKYFTRIDAEAPTLAFPFPMPDPIPNLHGDTLTTDFLLRANAYDRGDLYFNYGMQPDPLATLNPKRLTTVLPALLNSSNTHLQWAAVTALFEMPGDDFSADLLPHLIAGDPLPLADLQADSAAEKHLLALLDYANVHASAAEMEKIWTRLAHDQCFTPALRARASAATSTPAIAAYLRAASTYASANRSPFTN